MSNRRYPKTRKVMLDGGLAMLTADIKVMAVDADYVYADAHDFLDDVVGGARIATSANMTTKTTTLGVFRCDPFTFPTVGAGDIITAFIVFHDSGVEATSELIAYLDTRGDSTPVNIATDGGDVDFTPNAAGLFAI